MPFDQYNLDQFSGSIFVASHFNVGPPFVPSPAVHSIDRVGSHTNGNGVL